MRNQFIIQILIMITTHSNQFPKPNKEPLPTFEKAKFIFLGIKENCPKLYEYIKNQRR